MFYVFHLLPQNLVFNEIFVNFMPILQRSLTLIIFYKNKLSKNASKADQVRVPIFDDFWNIQA